MPSSEEEVSRASFRKPLEIIALYGKHWNHFALLDYWPKWFPSWAIVIHPQYNQLKAPLMNSSGCKVNDMCHCKEMWNTAAVGRGRLCFIICKVHPNCAEIIVPLLLI